MLTIYTITYNESFILQFMIDHYRYRFPNCKIVIYDNESIDNTIEIAKQNNCEIKYHFSGGYVDDVKLTYTKNNCWKAATTDWVMVCDPDELLDIYENDLIMEQNNNVSMINSEGFNMINLENNDYFKSITYGKRYFHYDKIYLFNKKFVKEINYDNGCHKNFAIGQLKYSEKKYKCYHWRYINPDRTFERYQMTAKRMCQFNIQTGMGNYVFNSKEQIEKQYEELRKNAIKVIE